MQRQWARLARRGWCAGVVPTSPRSLERIRREMRQAELKPQVLPVLPGLEPPTLRFSANPNRNSKVWRSGSSAILIFGAPSVTIGRRYCI